MFSRIFLQLAANSLYAEILSSYTAITIGYTQILLMYYYASFYCKRIKILTNCNIDRFIVNSSVNILSIEMPKVNKWTQKRFNKIEKDKKLFCS